MKKYSCKLAYFIWSVGILLLLRSCTEKTIQVVNLTCEYEKQAIVDVQHPQLRWQGISVSQKQSQTAYRILVSSQLELLDKNEGDYWDTGKVSSSSSIAIYGGKKLTSRTQFYWKIMVWDQDDAPSEWSEVSTWSMGLLEPSDWQAKWIGQRKDNEPDSTKQYPAPYFRKEFTLNKQMQSAKIYVTGLGFYELFLNGRRIGDQVLAPAVTNYDNRSLKKLLYHYDDQSTQRVFYQVFDVKEYLGQSSNAIGLVLGNGWYNQRDRTIEGNMWYDVPKMLVQLEITYTDGSREVVVSDESWKTTTGPLVRDGIFTGELYDARNELGKWNNADYDDDLWDDALSVRPPTGTLRVQQVPLNKVHRTVDTQFEKQTDSSYLYTLPETISGWCAIQVKGKSGDTVRLRFMSEEGFDYGQVDTYILSGDGVEHWEPKFTWHTFRKIEVISEHVTFSPASMTAKAIYTDVDRVGYFECDNELFNKINEAFVRTMHANFKGIVSSDPHRERLAYTGDAQVITPSLLKTFDMTRFLRKMFDDIDDARNKKTGFVPHTAPFGGGGGGPAWGSAYVIMPWEYYCHYGDTTVLRNHYEGMAKWIEYLGTRTDEHGLVVREEPNGWCLGEWCTPYNRIEIPPHFVNTAYYYHLTNIMSKVAGVLGKESDKQQFVDKANVIKSDFNKAFQDKETHQYWEGKQGANVLALAFGLVPDSDQDMVFASLLKHLEGINYHFDTGILATPLTLKVLSENGRADIAYRLMNQRDFPSYGYLLDTKNSTLWETWDGGVNDPNGSGRCHPMFGSVVSWFYTSLAGIKPDESIPGMKHFYITPTPVQDLNYCKASYESVYGEIKSEWSVDEHGDFQLQVVIPVNTTATVILPDWGGNKQEDSKRTPIELSSGKYEFSIGK